MPKNTSNKEHRGSVRSVIDTKESDGIDDPMEKIAIKSGQKNLRGCLPR